jgi:hypothetical protein
MIDHTGIVVSDSDKSTASDTAALATTKAGAIS